MGRNPATGEAIKIKASVKARITPLKGFKDVVAGNACACCGWPGPLQRPRRPLPPRRRLLPRKRGEEALSLKVRRGRDGITRPAPGSAV